MGGVFIWYEMFILNFGCFIEGGVYLRGGVNLI